MDALDYFECEKLDDPYMSGYEDWLAQLDEYLNGFGQALFITKRMCIDIFKRTDNDGMEYARGYDDAKLAFPLPSPTRKR